jgi:hypothetical protein
MPDNGDIRVVLGALQAEANKWRRLSDDMGKVRADVGRLGLYPSAFFFADVVAVSGHSMAYSAFHDWLIRLVGEATAEFEEIAGALDKSAELYAAADTRAAGDLTRIYGTRQQ